MITVKINAILLVIVNIISLVSASNITANGVGGGQSIKINILLLLPINNTYKFSVSKVLPSLNLACEELKKTDYGSVFDIAIIADTCDCTGITAPVNAMENIYGKRNHSLAFQAVFGPMCDYSLAPIARYASFWNVSVITVSALAQEFRRNKLSEYTTLTNVGPTMYWLDKFIVNLFEYFRWKHVILIFDKEYQDHETNFNCFLTMASLKAALLDKKIVVDYKLRDKLDPRPVEKILEDFVGNKYSIVMLCGSPDFIMSIMLAARKLGFINGEYTFINVDLYAQLHNENRILKPWLSTKSFNKSLIEYAIPAYDALMTITLKFDSRFGKYSDFKQKMFLYAKHAYKNESDVNFFVASFYDAMYVYIKALSRVVSAGFSPNNIKKVLEQLWNKEFDGITGRIVVDNRGERISEFLLHDFDSNREIFEPVISSLIRNNTDVVLEYNAIKRPIYWYKEKTGNLSDTPTCGYNGAKCPAKELPVWVWILISMGVLMVVSLAIVLISCRKLKFEAELKAMNWLIKWEDIRSEMMPLNGLSRNSSYPDDDIDESSKMMPKMEKTNQHVKAIMYKRNLCYVKKINKPKLEITRSLLLEVKKIKDLQHDHITRFIGLCISSNHQFIFTEYCQKGSLQDILENHQLQLDLQFKYHLMHDIIKGMLFLHSSEIKSHGNLSSTNCVVDSRFTLKITDFGLPTLRSRNYEFDEKFFKKQLWRAPELHYSLYQNSIPTEALCGTQKGDVFSFGIIMQEILYRNGVFYLTDKDKQSYFTFANKDDDNFDDMKVSYKDLFEKIKYGLRPSIEDGICSKEISELIKKCWTDSPNERPDFGTIRDSMRKTTKISGNILDNLLNRMEQYANNLEELVKERTEACENEKKRAETLLYRLLPLSVASTLMQGQKVTAETFNSVTIYFSDICGFTKLSSESTPMQVVDLLNELYTRFDSIIESYDVYKVETIGDAYMVVSGLPQRNATHAREIARMSLALLNNVYTFKIPHRPHDRLKLRIGIHTGSCVAGVVGLKMPRYCLFGDTVNTASRMESNGLPLKIHVSPQTKEELDKFGTFELELRGAVEMKGKGAITTYWLRGEKGGYRAEDQQLDSISDNEH